MPVLLDVYAACYDYIVKDVLVGAAGPGRAAGRKTLPRVDLTVPGIKMAVEGDVRLYKTSIGDLLNVVTTRYPPVGIVEELTDNEGNGDGEDGDNAFEIRRYRARPSAR